jgi:hypothetical protein
LSLPRKYDYENHIIKVVIDNGPNNEEHMSHLKRLLGVVAAPAITNFVSFALVQLRRFYEAANGLVKFPTPQQRIVSLQGLSITPPLVEFCKTDRSVGSHGRVNSDGLQFIEAARLAGLTLIFQVLE